MKRHSHFTAIGLAFLSCVCAAAQTPANHDLGFKDTPMLPDFRGMFTIRIARILRL